MPSSSAVDDRLDRASGPSDGALAAQARRWAAQGRRWESDVQERTARLAAGAGRLARSSAPALTLIYLVAVWVIFAGVLLTIHPSTGLGARLLAGLAGY